MKTPKGVPEQPDIFAAARLNSIDGLEQALEAGQSLQDTDERGRNSLHVAAHYGSREFIEAAIPKDFDALWMTDNSGRHPRAYATLRNDHETAAMMGRAMHPPGSFFEDQPDGSSVLVVPVEPHPHA